MFNVRTLEEQVDSSLRQQRMNVILLTTFGGLALLLASVGLYGVASYSVRSARARSASAWRSARSRRQCCASCSATG